MCWCVAALITTLPGCAICWSRAARLVVSPDRRVVHAQVIADLAHHHEPRVQANAHLQAEPALGLEGLGHVTDSALNAQGRVHGPAWTVFVRDGGAEQGHDPIAGVLVDRALEAVHLRRNTLEAAVDDLVHHFGVELLGECSEAGHVGEQDGDLLALAFQRAAGGEDLLGQVSRCIGEWSMVLYTDRRCSGGGGDARSPHQTSMVPS